MTSPGFYGKVPCLGDFIGRGLEGPFLEVWDEWLQGAIAASRKELDAEWLDAYLTSPLWRFGLAAGICGPGAWAGVVMPSVDRVGRYFPLTIAAPLDGACNPWLLLTEAGSWFSRVEELLLSALESDDFDVEGFAQEVEAVGPCVPMRGDEGAPEGGGSGWRAPLDGVDSAAAAWPALLWRMLAGAVGPCSVWWTAGSDLVQPSLLVCPGLPQAAGFGAMLDGRWQERAWTDLAQPGAASGAGRVQ